MSFLWIAVPLAILFLLMGALVIPIHLSFDASMNAPDEAFRSSARLCWAFGLLTVTLRKGPKKERRKPAPPKKKRPSRLRIKRLVTNPAFWARLKLLLVRLFRTVRWETLQLHARIGLDDPADTGRLWGWLTPFLAQVNSQQIEIQPEFDGPALTFQGEGKIQFVPLRVVWVVLSFAAAPATWQILWPAFKN